MNQRRRNTVGWGVAAVLIATAVGGALLPSAASAEEKQVFFRGGFAGLTSDRGGEAFTSAYNALGAGRNDGSTGWYLGAGLDIGKPRTSSVSRGCRWSVNLDWSLSGLNIAS